MPPSNLTFQVLVVVLLWKSSVVHVPVPQDSVFSTPLDWIFSNELLESFPAIALMYDCNVTTWATNTSKEQAAVYLIKPMSIDQSLHEE